jgi:shikimate dehydrogenase
VLVFDLVPEQVEALVADLGGPSSPLRTLPQTTEALVESARGADLLVNATPVGMSPRPDGSVWPEGVPVPSHLAVFDLVYNPLETRLLRQARKSGAHPIAGLDMLVRQGAISFEMWTGEEPPIDVMRAACREALGV